MAKASEVFNRLLSVQSERNAEITRIFRDFRAESERIAGRYSERIAAEKSAELASTSRAAIEAAHARAGERAQVAVRELKEEFRKFLLTPPDEALMNLIRTARDFDVKLSRSELESFADAAQGNLFVLRCLAEVAAQSGYRLDFVGADDFTQDLEAVERAFRPSAWCPDGFGNEALAVLPNVVWRGVDQGRPDGIRIATARAAAEGARRNLEQGRERWSRIGDPLAQKSVYTLEKLTSQAPQNAP